MALLGAASGEAIRVLLDLYNQDRPRVNDQMLKLAAKWNIIIPQLIFRSEPISRSRIP